MATYAASSPRPTRTRVTSGCAVVACLRARERDVLARAPTRRNRLPTLRAAQ